MPFDTIPFLGIYPLKMAPPTEKWAMYEEMYGKLGNLGKADIIFHEQKKT